MNTPIQYTDDFEAYWRDNGVTYSVPAMELAFKEVAFKAWSARVCTLPHAPYTPNDCLEITPSTTPMWMREAIAFLFDDCKINAIKVIRNDTGLTLKDSLLIVTHLEKNYKLGVYDPAAQSFLADKPLDTLTPMQDELFHRFVTLIEAEYSELLDKWA